MRGKSLEQKVQILWDKQEIQETKLRFGRALDLHDWELYQTCFVDPFEVDMSDFIGRAPTIFDRRKDSHRILLGLEGARQ